MDSNLLAGLPKKSYLTYIQVMGRIAMKKRQSEAQKAHTRSLNQNCTGYNKENCLPAPKKASHRPPTAAALRKAQDTATRERLRANDLERKLRNSTRREQRALKEITKLNDAIVAAEAEVVAAQKEAEQRVRATIETTAASEKTLVRQLREANALLNAHHHDAVYFQTLSLGQKNELIAMRQLVRKLEAKAVRYQRLRASVRKATHKAHLLGKMKKKGSYRPEIRALSRMLVSTGCGGGKVGALIKDIAGLFGIKVDKVMGRRTVARTVKEGLVMSHMQLAYEMQATEGQNALLVHTAMPITHGLIDLTLSGDSTSRRHQNYQGHHVTCRVPERQPDGSVKLLKKPVTRFLGIRSTVDHSSELSKDAWVKTFMECEATYTASPLAQRTEKRAFDLRAVCRKLRGMCSDHAAGEKSTSDMMEGLK